MMRPMANVSAAATKASANWRPPLTRGLRAVNNDSDAPTTNIAPALSPALAITKGVLAFPPKKKGITGTSAPTANARNAPIDAPHGEPSSDGSSPTPPEPSCPAQPLDSP